MTEEMPLDLRSLGDVDSPEVVREALRRFRRSALRTTASVAVVGLVAVTFALGANARRSLGDRIEAASGVSPGALYQVQGMTAVLQKVADLGDTIGLHFTIAAPDLHTYDDPRVRDTYSLSFASPRSMDVHPIDSATVYDQWVELFAPADGRIAVNVLRLCTLTGEGTGGCTVRDPRHSTGMFVVDLGALGVPQEIWRRR